MESHCDDLYPRKKFVLTKRVNEDWYRRYAKVLSYDERVFIQPLRDIRQEKALLKALETPKNEEDRALEISKRLTEARHRKIQTVLKILEGNVRNLDLSSLKPVETPLSHMQEEKGQEQTLFLRQRAIRPPGYVLSKRSKWRLFWEDPDVMEKLRAMVRKARREKVIAKWLRAIRLVQSIQRFNAYMAYIARTTQEVFKNVTETTSDEHGELDFQKNKFKATNAGKPLDQETIFTLTKPEIYRTKDQIQHAAKALRVMKTFAEFPAYLQNTMCQIAFYLELEKDKIIIREGQPANSFYFLLSGRVAAVKVDPASGRGSQFSVLSTHTMGALLGEEGISAVPIRHYSLYTLEKTRMICVSIDDYRRVCAETTGRDGSPEHISFLSQLNFLKLFPMRQLVENSEDNIILFYNRPGSVVSSNIEKSDNIFVVYKGSCKVIAELSQRNKSTRKVHLPPIINYDSFEMFTPQSSLGSLPSRLTLNSSHRASRSSQRPSMIYPTSTAGRLSLSSDKPKSVAMIDNLTKFWGRGTMAECIHRKDSVFNVNLIEAGSMEKLVVSRLTDFRHKSWVLVKTLREGDAVGLEYLDLGELPPDEKWPRITVVSEGAEIISVSKSFIMDNMSASMKKDLRASSYIMPTEDDLKTELERRQTWKRFQNGVMENLFGAKHRAEKDAKAEKEQRKSVMMRSSNKR